MPTRYIVFVALLLTAFLAACSQPEVAPADDAEAARAKAAEALAAEREELAQRAGSLTLLKTEWTMGDITSTISGYYENETLRLIEEEMRMGDFGDASAKYFYRPDGSLFAYSERKNSRSGTKSDSVKTERITLSLLFGETGALIGAERTVDGAAVPLVGIEEQGVRMHARELEAALTEARDKAR